MTADYDKVLELLRGFNCPIQVRVQTKCDAEPLPDVTVPDFIREKVAAEKERIAGLGGVERAQAEMVLYHRILHANSIRLVVAGNYRQYRDYMWRNKLSRKQAVYVNNPENCRGYREYVLVFTGQVYLNPLDGSAALEMLKERATWVIVDPD